MEKSVILGYEFDQPLATDEMERVRENIEGGYTEEDAGHRVYANFSPNGGHMFILADAPVKTMPNGEIIGVEVDLVGPAINTVRPEDPEDRDTTEEGNGWKKIYDATHDVQCGCHTCEED